MSQENRNWTEECAIFGCFKDCYFREEGMCDFWVF